MEHVSPELQEEFAEAVMSPGHGAIFHLAGQLKDCTDVMPPGLCATLDMESGSTYADAVRENWPAVYEPEED